MKILKISIVLVALLAFIYINQVPLQRLWAKISDLYLPCTVPITYSLGTFDTRFGISKSAFLDSLKQAETIWEKPINKDLFQYKESGGDVKVNLEYDSRQEATINLGKLSNLVHADKATYDTYKAQYQELEIKYENAKAAYTTALASFEEKKSAYDASVAYWNKKGGAPKQEYDRLTEEKKVLDANIASTNQLQNTIRTDIDGINALVPVLNQIAGSLNLNISEYNQVGKARGEEFEEGLYKSTGDGQEIDIYQFDTTKKLIRVLAHEFGHAMNIDHVKDPSAIMYAFNQGTSLALAEDDLSALKNHCNLK